MIRRISEAGRPCDHIPDERLAALAAGIAQDGMLPSDETHLFGCERCFSTVAELARAEMSFDRNQELTLVPSDLMDRARSLPGRDIHVESDAGTGTSPRPYRSRAPIWAGGMLGSLALALLIVFAMPHLPGSNPVPISVSGVDWEFESPAIYGFESDPLHEAPRLRSGGATHKDELARMKGRYAQGGSAELLERIVALALATGSEEDARLYSRTGIREYPGSSRVRVLRAIFLRTDGRLADAEDLLSAALEVDPDDDVARFNLGIVMLEQGDEEGAELLSALAREDPDSPLAQRVLRYVD